MGTGEPRQDAGGESAGRLRIDKWLWFARFFKTRSLATAAVAAGRVQVNRERVKRSRVLLVGDVLDIQVGSDALTVVVRGLPSRRGPAAEARLHYEETPASVARRARLQEQHRLATLSAPHSDGRPDKRERRELLRIQRGQGED